MGDHLPPRPGRLRGRDQPQPVARAAAEGEHPMTRDKERLELIHEVLHKLEKIQNLEEIVRGTKDMIKKHRADSESILNRLRELDEGVLPFDAQEPPDPEEDEDVQVDIGIEQEPPVAQPEGGLQ